MTNQNIADSVIKIFFEVGIDGETMEYIINKMGMRDQMINQLYLNKVKYNLEQTPTSECNCGKHTFTRQQLIDFTRGIQERCELTSIAAVRGAGMDFDDMVALELDYDNQISIEFDERSLYSEIESAIDDAFETDDEAIYSEALDVIENMNEV